LELNVACPSALNVKATAPTTGVGVITSNARESNVKYPCVVVIYLLFNKKLNSDEEKILAFINVVYQYIN
jgi:hypothetical protein